MRNIKLYLKAACLGAITGIIIPFAMLDGSIIKWKIENYKFSKWLYNSEFKYPKFNNEKLANKEIVEMFKYKISERSKPLVTYGLFTCCGLIIDDKKENKHYLGHFTSAENPKEIEKSIRENFSDLSDLEIYVITGEFPNSSIFPDKPAAENVYIALKNLKLSKKAKKYKSENIGIVNGKLFIPNWKRY